DGAQEGEGEPARTYTRFNDPGAGEDVGHRDDLRGILRVDGGGAAGHEEYVVRQQRTQREEFRAGGGGDDAALGVADEVVVGEGRAVGVQHLPLDEGDRGHAAFGVGELHAIAGSERSGALAGTCGWSSHVRRVYLRGRPVRPRGASAPREPGRG